MELFDLALKAGQQVQTTVKGRFFRMLSGEGRVKLETDNGVNSSVITGIGLDLLSASGEGFAWIRVTSPIDQTVTVLVSDKPTTDSRLSGEVDVNGLLQVLNKGGTQWNSETVALDSGTPGQQLLSNNSERVSASVQSDVDMWIGADNTVAVGAGIKVPAGNTLNAENSGAVFVAVADNGTAQIMESIA